MRTHLSEGKAGDCGEAMMLLVGWREERGKKRNLGGGGLFIAQQLRARQAVGRTHTHSRTHQSDQSDQTGGVSRTFLRLPAPRSEGKSSPIAFTLVALVVRPAAWLGVYLVRSGGRYRGRSRDIDLTEGVTPLAPALRRPVDFRPHRA